MERDHVDLILEQWIRERPDLDPSPMGVIGRTMRAARSLDRGLQEAFRPFGLAGWAFDVLAALRRSGPPFQLTPTKLAATLMLSSGAMTNRLDNLEGDGLIERLPDPTDRRGVLVALTPKGRALIDEAVAAHVANERRLLGALSPEEQRTLAALLRKLLLSLDGAAPPERA